jgi:hypothetical protein
MSDSKDAKAASKPADGLKRSREMATEEHELALLETGMYFRKEAVGADQSADGGPAQASAPGKSAQSEPANAVPASTGSPAAKSAIPAAKPLLAKQAMPAVSDKGGGGFNPYDNSSALGPVNKPRVTPDASAGTKPKDAEQPKRRSLQSMVADKLSKITGR